MFPIFSRVFFRSSLMMLAASACLYSSPTWAQQATTGCDTLNGDALAAGNNIITVQADCTIAQSVDFKNDDSSGTASDTDADLLTIGEGHALTFNAGLTMTNLEHLVLQSSATMSGLSDLDLEGGLSMGSKASITGLTDLDLEGELIMGSEASIAGLTTLTVKEDMTLDSKAALDDLTNLTVERRAALGREVKLTKLETLTFKNQGARLYLSIDAEIRNLEGFTTLTADNGGSEEIQGSVSNDGTLKVKFDVGEGKHFTVYNRHEMIISDESTFGWDGTTTGDIENNLVSQYGRVIIERSDAPAADMKVREVRIEDGHLVVRGQMNLGEGTLQILNFGKLIFEIAGVTDGAIDAGQVKAGTVTFPTDTAAEGAKVGVRLGEGVSGTGLAAASGVNLVEAGTLQGSPALESAEDIYGLSGAELNVDTTAGTLRLSFAEDPGGTGTALFAVPDPTPIERTSAQSGSGGGAVLGVIGVGALLWLLQQAAEIELDYREHGLTGLPMLAVDGEAQRRNVADRAWSAHQRMDEDRAHQAWGMQVLKRGSWGVGFLMGQSQVREETAVGQPMHVATQTRGDEYAMYANWAEGAWSGSMLLAHSRQRARGHLNDFSGVYSLRTTGRGYLAQASVGREFTYHGWRLRPRVSVMGMRVEEDGFRVADDVFSVQRSAAHWQGMLWGASFNAHYDLMRNTGRFLRLRARLATTQPWKSRGSQQHFTHQDHTGALTYSSSAHTGSAFEHTQYSMGLGLQAGQTQGWRFGSGYLAATDENGNLDHGLMMGVHRAF